MVTATKKMNNDLHKVTCLEDSKELVREIRHAIALNADQRRTLELLGKAADCLEHYVGDCSDG